MHKIVLGVFIAAFVFAIHPADAQQQKAGAKSGGGKVDKGTCSRLARAKIDKASDRSGRMYYAAVSRCMKGGPSAI
jgi:hypothetical protein